MKLFLGVFIPVLLMAATVFAQPNLNKIWVQGSPITFRTTFDGNGPTNVFWDTTNILTLLASHSNICDINGNLLLVSNGGAIYDGSGNIIENGDTIIPNLIYGIQGGNPHIAQASIILPLPDSIYYVFANTMSDSSFYYWYYEGLDTTCDLLLYSVVDMKLNGGAGKVAKKRIPAFSGTNLTVGMTACRHGNGHDWWLIKQGHDSNVVYTFLVTKDTVLGPYTQPFLMPARFIGSPFGQSAVSNDGTKYAVTLYNNSRSVFMADFDRCSGLLSNPKAYKVPMASMQSPWDTTLVDSTTVSLAFSPNDSFLYVGMWYNIQQLELNNLDSATAWVRVAGIDTTDWDHFMRYNSMYLGHDDKIYIGILNGFAAQMSAIDQPNKKGTACGFCPKCLRFPKFHGLNSFVAQPPNMPNYRLGAKTPSCDSTQDVPSMVHDQLFRIYPNPADATLIIEYVSSGRFELTDMLGRVLLQTELVKGQNRLAIKTDHLPAGMYAYRYVTTKSGQITGKLVISR